MFTLASKDGRVLRAAHCSPPTQSYCAVFSLEVEGGVLVGRPCLSLETVAATAYTEFTLRKHNLNYSTKGTECVKAGKDIVPRRLAAADVRAKN